MFVKIVALAIGVLIAVAGIMFLVKEKEDAESKKIYMITTIIGIVIAAVAAVLLIK